MLESFRLHKGPYKAQIGSPSKLSRLTVCSLSKPSNSTVWSPSNQSQSVTPTMLVLLLMYMLTVMLYDDDVMMMLTSSCASVV